MAGATVTVKLTLAQANLVREVVEAARKTTAAAAREAGTTTTARRDADKRVRELNNVLAAL